MKSTGKVNRRTGQEVFKPECVIRYNQLMGAVDNVSALMHPYRISRKGLKWFRKLFEVFLDICVLNSYILFNKQKPASGKVKHFDFMIALITDMVSRHLHVGVHLQHLVPKQNENILRLSERHFPSKLPPTAARERPTRQCHVCGYRKNPSGKRLRRETRYFCAECNVPLCVVPCFRQHHTVRDLQTIADDSSDSD